MLKEPGGNGCAKGTTYICARDKLKRDNAFLYEECFHVLGLFKLHYVSVVSCKCFARKPIARLLTVDWVGFGGNFGGFDFLNSRRHLAVWSNQSSGGSLRWGEQRNNFILYVLGPPSINAAWLLWLRDRNFAHDAWERTGNKKGTHNSNNSKSVRLAGFHINSKSVKNYAWKSRSCMHLS